MIDYGRRRTSGVWTRVRNIAIGAGVLLVLLVGAGVAYTWYIGTLPSEQEPVATLEANDKPTAPTPSQPDPEGVVGISKQVLTSPVPPGENASITIKTNPQVNCEIIVTYGDLGDEDQRSTDSGLEPKTANAYGVIMWTWTIEADRAEGEYPIEITCANEAKSAYFKDFIDVAFPNQD